MAARRLPRRELSPELTRLRLLATLAPIGFVVVILYLLRGPFHRQLHEYPGFLYVLAVVSMAVSGFSFVIFAVIAGLERRMQRQNRELAALNEQLAALLAVGAAASSSLHLGEMLDAALDAILAVSSADAAEVWLLRDGELLLERRHGAEPAEGPRLRVGEGLPGLAAQSGRPVVVHDLGSDPRAVAPPRAERGFESFCAFPLRRRGEVVGVLGVAAHDPRALSGGSEHRLLEGIGEQVAVAVDNARLHERVLEDAVLEERERLARELHDGLAQVLAYVNTQTIGIRRLLSLDRRAEAERQVGEMEAAARRVYSDVREAILGLRSSRGALVPSLRAYLAEYGRIAGVDLRLDADEQVERLRLPSSTEIQLVRIVQEALANVRKHAHARTATVRLRLEEGALAVEVADDGRGFDASRPRQTGWPHFGLQTMRERAAALGAGYELVSAPGEGTRVAVTLPLASLEERAHAGAAR